MRLLLSATIFIAGSLLVSVAGQLNTAYQWKYIDYLWTSEAQRQNAISSGAYNYANIIPMDVDVSQEGRVFISMLGSVGVPARLGTVTNNIGPSGPLIQPYPNWGWHDSNNCNSILDVYRITIDKCNRLWIADAGLTEGLARKCKAKLLAFDLNTDRLITRVVIPDNIATNSKNGQTLLANVKVETYGPYCSNTTIIVAQDSQRLRYANNFKVIQPSASIPEEELWVLTNQFVTFESRRLNFNNWNFFVLRGSVDRLIAGSKCEMPRETALALQQVNQGNPPIIN
ncbi:hypothetical protein QAD02_019990 [Eretmocerus hayati]|uniref:Uncharacterized protein n=1 Tax=Eretmocerus hayati TaxID=131215 RepID=A0ACC2PM79_9HYME|nr:hypothetical protein QAD02_019990 [Eretmocerus hayati]